MVPVTGPGRPGVSTGHRTGLGFFGGRPTGHRDGLGFFGGRPTGHQDGLGCFLGGKKPAQTGPGDHGHPVASPVQYCETLPPKKITVIFLFFSQKNGKKIKDKKMKNDL